MEDLRLPVRQTTIIERNANPTLYHDLIGCRVKMWTVVLVLSRIFSAASEVSYPVLNQTPAGLQRRAVAQLRHKITVRGAKTRMHRR